MHALFCYFGWILDVAGRQNTVSWSCLIISLALRELSQSTYSSCLSEVRVRPWAQIIEGMSDQTRLKQAKNVMNTALKFKKMWSIPQTDIHPGFRFTGCRAVNLTRVMSSNLDRSPLQIRMFWEHCELWKYWWMTWQSKSYPLVERCTQIRSENVRQNEMRYIVYTP